MPSLLIYRLQPGTVPVMIIRASWILLFLGDIEQAERIFCTPPVAVRWADDKFHRGDTASTASVARAHPAAGKLF